MAEALAVQAAERDDLGVLRMLAELRERAGDREGAEALYRQAAERGDPGALRMLAELREQAELRERAGDREGAEALHRHLQDADRRETVLPAWLRAWKGERTASPSSSLPPPDKEFAHVDSLLSRVAEGLVWLCEPEMIYQLARDQRAVCRAAAADVAALLAHAEQAVGNFCGDDLQQVAVREMDLEDLDDAHWSDGSAGGEPTRWPSAVESQIIEHSDAVPWAPGEFVVRFGAPIPTRT